MSALPPSNLAMAARRFADLFARLEQEHVENASRKYREYAEAQRAARRARTVERLNTDAGSVWRLS